ncbi:MAG: ribosome biogenesis GTPase Der [Cytophagales bacterium]|nr:ribosome biogenesis GTPase Der [Cytophagales bacterium]
MSNIVAIVGRPNVGKSTLFNRLIGQRKAITDNESGVTRDRHYGYSDWGGRYFTVIDTGGYVTGSADIFEEMVREQVDLAMDEADVILFMVDCIEGIHGLDNDFANILRKNKKPVIVTANKADNTERFHMAGEFYSFGLGEVFPISSQDGSGTGELLDEVIKHFRSSSDESTDNDIPKLAVLGRPNVGKSSLVNVLLGKQRTIVTDIAGTTRDAIHTHYNAFGKEFLLIDTAGLRKKSKVRDNIEFYSTLRAVRALEEADVCVIMLDATRGIEIQDINIVTLADRKNKGIVLLVNKWDLVEKDHDTARQLEDHIKKRLKPINYMPIIFASVVNKQRIHRVLEEAVKVYEKRKQKVPTSKLNDLLLKEIENHPPPAKKGKHVKIKYVTQLPVSIPVFAFFCNLPQYIQEPYTRFLENKIREHFNFEGVPIKIIFKKK